MGGTMYNAKFRSSRAEADGYFTKSVNEIFTQQKERRVHEMMLPFGMKLRECRDSGVHPAAIPIIIALDVTGSMGHIPHDLIKDGLPKLMSTLIQAGVTDASVCFVAIGDHECDRGPFQAGQFESGDAELDMWLTRTWLEGGGGGNAGESYLIPWYFGSRHTVTDHWEKRGKKGFLITIGDEPCLSSFPLSAQKEIFDGGQANITAEQALAEAQEKYHVYHINLVHGGRNGSAHWKQKLGDNSIDITNYQDVPTTIASTIIAKMEQEGFTVTTDNSSITTKSDEIIL